VTAETGRRAARQADADRTSTSSADPAAVSGRRPGPAAEPGPEPGHRPLYARLLRLRHLRLTGWQRVLLSDGVLLLAVLLVLADLATAWTLLVLPLAVAVVVKLHDVAVGLLAAQTPTAPVPQDRRRRDGRRS
jgi:hypothetical protein